MLIELGKAVNVAEVGVAYGYHAQHILETNPQISYLGVDPYLAWYDPDDSFGADVEHLLGLEPQDAMDLLYECVSFGLEKQFPGRSNILRGRSADFVDELAGKFFDLVFVDGDHQETAVLADLNFWWSKVANGGLLCGDDYDWPGVAAAVTTFEKEVGRKPVLIQNSSTGHKIFAFYKPGNR